MNQGTRAIARVLFHALVICGGECGSGVRAGAVGDLGDGVDEGVDVGFGGGASGGGADAAVGAVADGVVCEGGAVDPASDGDVVLFVECGRDVAGADAVDVEEDDGCAVFGGGQAVDGEVVDGGEPVQELFGERHFVFVRGGVEVFDGGEEPGEADGVGGARFEGVGECGGHLEPGCDGSGSAASFAEDACFVGGAVVGVGAWGEVEGAGAGGSSEPFVAGDGEEVDVGRLDVDGDVAEGLGAVDEDECVGGGVACGADDVVDGLDGAHGVGGVGDADEGGAFVAGAGDGLGVDDAVVVGLDDGECDDVVDGVAVEGAEDGVVFEGGGDDVDGEFAAAALGGADDAVDREVERVGASVGEDDARWGGCVDELGECGAGLFDGVGGASREFVPAPPGVAGGVCEEVGHGACDVGVLGEACGGVVEVDEVVHVLILRVVRGATTILRLALRPNRGSAELCGWRDDGRDPGERGHPRGGVVGSVQLVGRG